MPRAGRAQLDYDRKQVPDPKYEKTFPYREYKKAGTNGPFAMKSAILP